MTEQPESGRLLDMLHRLFSRASLMDLDTRKKPTDRRPDRRWIFLRN